MRTASLLRMLTVCGMTSMASAQTGIIDQVSPLAPPLSVQATFDLSNTAMVWRAQVRAGVAGRLEGVRLLVGHGSPSTAMLRVRTGTAEVPGPIRTEALIRRTEGLPQFVFVDLTAAALDLSPGQTFVLEFQGNGSGMFIYGSHAVPALYPEPLYANGASFFDGFFRIGFETFMLTGDLCAADLSGSSDPNDPRYGDPDGVADASDFFFYLDQFAAQNLALADLTGASDPNDAAYGVPDGFIDASDFFYYLDLFVQGCP